MWRVASVGDTEFWVHQRHPVCVVRRRNRRDEVLSWADLDLPEASLDVDVWPAHDDVWVLYLPSAGPATPAGSAAVRLRTDGSVSLFPRLGPVRIISATASGLCMAPVDAQINAYDTSALRWVGGDRPNERDAQIVGPRIPKAFIRDESDGPADPGVRWPLVNLPPAEQQEAIRRLTEHLPGPVNDGLDSMTQIQVEVVGEWPDTTMELSFRHPLYPGGRMLRTYQVFDGAGRVIEHEYPEMELVEDLLTGDIPPAARAVDGVLDITRNRWPVIGEPVSS